MNEALALFLDKSRFFMEMWTLCLLFSWSLERRERFWLRAFLALAGGVVLSGLLPNSFLLIFPIGLFLAALSVVLCRCVSFWDGLYCAACAYATQHFYYTVHNLIFRLLELPMVRPSQQGIPSILLFAAICLLFYFLFSRHLADGQRYYMNAKRATLSAVLILVVVIVLNEAGNTAYVEDGRNLYLVCQAYAMFCCVFFLAMQVSQVRQAQIYTKLEFERQLARQQREQYELTKENIDLINRKCHDLKHQMTALRTFVPEDQRERYLQEIERGVQIYDSTLKTGNEVLDTVLTEKGLYCEAHQISMTCIADGARLSFLDPVDIYTIFGNALDNAIECVSQLDDPEKRVVSVSVTARSGLLILQFENYHEGLLVLRDGLPQTTKEEKEQHGFGLHSIRHTVEKYGGYMTIQPGGNLFQLRASIPIPA